MRMDPGWCIVCDAPHSACTKDSGPILVPQLPARDELSATAQSVEPPAELAVDEPEPFTSAEYRGRDRKTGRIVTERKPSR